MGGPHLINKVYAPKHYERSSKINTMKHLIIPLRIYFERHGFAVSTRLAEFLGMKVKSVRLFFIYASFTTLLGGLFLYLTLAFWLKLKDLIYAKRTSVFDL